MRQAAVWATIFDMDGVVVDTHDAHYAAVRILCRRHGLSCSKETFDTHAFGVPNRVWLPVLFGGHLSEDELARLSEEKERIFRDLYAAFAVPLPGLRELLSLLEQKDISRALASSAPRANIDAILDFIGLARFFPVILDETSVASGKPDPAIFLLAAHRLGLPPEACIAFEDSPAGTTAARDAGCIVVAVTTSYSVEKLGRVDAVVPDFRSVSVDGLTGLVRGR